MLRKEVDGYVKCGGIWVDDSKSAQQVCQLHYIVHLVSGVFYVIFRSRRAIPIICIRVSLDSLTCFATFSCELEVV